MAGSAPQRSLKARAIQWLAQREHSRVELQRKLLARARADARASRAGEPGGAIDDATESANDVAVEGADISAARVSEVLDWLEAQGHLSPQRFVESRVRMRAPRYGNLRIRQELAQHALALPAETAQALGGTELERVCAVLARKYKTAPQNPAERARRARFLASRGFSSDTIHQALRRASPTPP